MKYVLKILICIFRNIAVVIFPSFDEAHHFVIIYKYINCIVQGFPFATNQNYASYLTSNKGTRETFTPQSGDGTVRTGPE